MKRKPTKTDFELISIGGMVRLLDDLDRRLFALRDKKSEDAKKRACAYLLHRHKWLFEWMKEI